MSLSLRLHHKYPWRVIVLCAYAELQELRVFLEAEGSLGDSLQWQQLQPVRGGLLEGISRLPRQLIGARAVVRGDVGLGEAHRSV